MYPYQEGETLLKKLHPAVAVAYIAAIILLSLLFSHPLYLLALILSLGAVFVSSGLTKEWLSYLRFSLPLMVLIVLINFLFVRAGTTVLLKGPFVPVIGQIRLTLEALCYGVGMGVRLLVVISSFCLFTPGVHPDRVLRLLGRRWGKTMLALSISLRMFPLMAADYRRIKEVQSCRGVSFEAGSLWSRIKKHLPLMSVMLLSSLERAFQLAEALQARGYGMGKRTEYTKELWRPGDFLVLTSLILGTLGGVLLTLAGETAYRYYPRLQPIRVMDITAAGVLSLMLASPAVLDWGWKKWPLLRSRI
jgi:energy-coupling factor transport system permease protein